MTNKLGVVLASAAAVAFLAVTGCASQQAAAPASTDASHASTKNACKNMAKCKQMHHKKAAKKESTTSSTETKSTDTKTTTTSSDSTSK